MVASTTHVQDLPPPGDSWVKCARFCARHWKGQVVCVFQIFEMHGCFTAVRRPRVFLGGGLQTQSLVQGVLLDNFLFVRSGFIQKLFRNFSCRFERVVVQTHHLWRVWVTVGLNISDPLQMERVDMLPHCEFCVPINLVGRLTHMVRG